MVFVLGLGIQGLEYDVILFDSNSVVQLLGFDEADILGMVRQRNALDQ